MFEMRVTNMARIVLFAGKMSTTSNIHPMNVTRRSHACDQTVVSHCAPA